LQAVYRTGPVLEASNATFLAGKLNMQAMLDRLQCIRYVSTLVLEQLDPELKTFFNINTPLDLKRAEQMLSRPSSRAFALSR
jgi:molybdopterin-guanine dinucleotide biosynthesis protein A